jgi:TFIIF-interacting CTD phosphatase-like protein
METNLNENSNFENQKWEEKQILKKTNKLKFFSISCLRFDLCLYDSRIYLQLLAAVSFCVCFSLLIFFYCLSINIFSNVC